MHSVIAILLKHIKVDVHYASNNVIFIVIIT